jgi:hypothetical protein
MTFVADNAGEIAHHGRVGKVLLLRHAGHQEMLANQPDDQFGVFSGHPVIRTKRLCVDRSELGMITATPLGDIVKQGRNVKDPGIAEIADQATAERVLVRELRHRKAAQVSHHLQNVLIDGIDVEQIVLHLANNASEARQIATENAGLVHPSEDLQQPMLLLENGQEARAVLRIAAEFVVDQLARAPQSALSARSHPLQFSMFLEKQKGLENGRRSCVEHLLIDHVEKLVHILEALIDWLRRLIGRWKQRRADVLQQDGVDLGDGLGCPVVLLHQLLAGPARGRGSETELLGECRLVLEEQAIFPAPGLQVELRTQQTQEGLAGFEDSPLLVGDEAALLEILPALAVARCLSNPQDQLQIAQSPGPVLAVRFQAVGRVAEALMTVFLLHPLGLEKNACVQTALDNRREACKEPGTAGQQAGFDHRCLNRDVAGSFLQTLLDGAHAVADFEANVPEEADQLLELRGQQAVGLLR